MQLQRNNTECMTLSPDAYNAGILHCDFSPGNVVITSDSQGWLIDWDLSKPTISGPHVETPRRATRTVRVNILHML